MPFKYKFSFDVWAFLLFIAIMIPNFIWFAVPAPSDILRADSVTGAVDTVATICQIAMVAFLCVLKNREAKKICVSPCIITTVICCLIYFACWVFYYLGIANSAVIIGLTLPPCLAFLFFAVDRKNMIAIIPVISFTVCHLIYAVVNFIL